MTDAPVTQNDELERFESSEDGEVALLDYRRNGDRITLVHTEVPERLEGRGLGGRLVKFALEYARENDLTVVPVCEFVQSYLKRHPEEAQRVRLASPDA